MSGMIERFEAVRQGIAGAARAAGRDPSGVTLVAVSKGHGPEKLAELARYWQSLGPGAGRPVFGESYAQEASAKIPEVELLAGFRPEWHFVGHIQSRKAKDVAGRVRLIHSLDSLTLARSLARERQKLSPAGTHAEPERVLVQVNIGEEPQKSGVAPTELLPFLHALAAMPEILVEGLMCLPPDLPDPEDARPYFKRLRELRDEAATALGTPLPHLSMGMSHDYEVAVAEGATLVRVGTAIFGPRGT